MTERRTLGHSTMDSLLKEIFDLVMDGWAIDPDQPAEANPFGGAFTAYMLRSDASVNSFKERADVVQERPKMTPQERMAHARAQRGKASLKLGEVINE